MIPRISTVAIIRSQKNAGHVVETDWGMIIRECDGGSRSRDWSSMRGFFIDNCFSFRFIPTHIYIKTLVILRSSSSVSVSHHVTRPQRVVTEAESASRVCRRCTPELKVHRY
jgi:hypothetical protein